ncbi:MAG: glycosyltransferase family 4 protein, partial [Rhizonema sp. PD38]|nr:glycosyltransferase family 4 protein [Rhizonema sp. PD38]
RLILIIYSLSSGGAERVMSIMANYWVAKGWEIIILTFNAHTVTPFYYLDSRIIHIPLGIAANSPNLIIGICNNLKRIQTLKSVIVKSKPDAIISFMDTTNVITLLATRGLNVPVVISERNNPSMTNINEIWKHLRQLTYLFADKLVVQNKTVLNYFSSTLQSSVCIIPNPVLSPPKEKEPLEKLFGERSLIAMGRLERQKGFDILLQAFTKVKDHHPEWTLTIFGEGGLRSELESLRNQLGLVERVHFPGVVKNSYQFLQQGDLFIMSSRFEGFPNALCEAMACGLAVISTDCPSGPSEIIRHDIDGILVPNEDVSALAVAMDCLMSDKERRKRLACRASEIVERFSVEKIMDMWKVVLKEVVVQ